MKPLQIPKAGQKRTGKEKKYWEEIEALSDLQRLYTADLQRLYTAS
jgi:hypothetical protein